MRFVMVVAVGCLFMGIADPLSAQQGQGSGHEGHAGMQDMQREGMHNMKGMPGASEKSGPAGFAEFYTTIPSQRNPLPHRHRLLPD